MDYIIIMFLTISIIFLINYFNSIDYKINNLKQNLKIFFNENSQIDNTHGYEHALKVYNHAKKSLNDIKLSKEKKIIVLAASLLHDVDDKKYFSDNINYQNAKKIIYKSNIDDILINNIVELIELVSTSANKDNIPEYISSNNEYWKLIPRYSDRLEATGEIGIIRCYKYTLKKNNPLFCENTPKPKFESDVWKYASLDRFNNYNGNSDSMIDHFYDKLLHISKPNPKYVKNKYLEEEQSKRVKPLIEICLQYGLTNEISMDYINSLKH